MSTEDRKAKARAAAPSAGKGANAVVINAIRDSGGSGAMPRGVSAGEPIEPYADANPPEDAPVVDVYEDFRCPICKMFDQVSGETTTELAQEGTIRLRVHLKTVIDANTGGDSSAVAGSSAVCALDQGMWTEYHSALFSLQPQQETAEGFPKEAYTEAAEKAGMSGAQLEEWQQCTDDETYVDYVRSVDDASSEAGINGTPVIAVNGTTLDWAGLTDGQSLSTFDSERFEQILTSGDVPKDLVQQQ